MLPPSSERNPKTKPALIPRARSVAVGPLLTLAVAVQLERLHGTRLDVPNPGMITIAAVVFSAAWGGLVSGLVSAVVSIGFALEFFSIPGQMFHYAEIDLRRLIVYVICTPAIAWMVGALRRRQRRRSELEAASLAEGHYRELLEDLDAIVWEAMVEPFRYTFVSRRAEAIFGHPVERWLADPDFWQSLMLPEDRDQTMARCREAAARREDYDLEYRVRTADGRLLWVRDRVHMVPNGTARPVRMRGVIVDVTERKHAENTLRGSEARKRAILESALDCIITMDHQGRVVEFNPAAERTFGYRASEAVGRELAELVIPPALREQHRRGLERYLTLGVGPVIGRRVELTAMRADRSEFPVELTISRMPGEGSPMFTGFVRDITERRRAEDETRHALSLLSATLESTADGILVVDREGKIVSCNRQFVEMWRIPGDVIASRDDRRAIEAVLDQLKDPEAFHAKVRELYDQADADSFDVLEFTDDRVFERYSQPQRIGGVSVGRVWSFRDVTGRRRAETELRLREEQLRASQKMDAIGQLAGGIAHDFNNLLTAILGYNDQIRDGLGTAHPLYRASEEVRRASERAAALTRQLLAFGRRQMLEPRVLDLGLLVAEMLRMLRRMIAEPIVLESRTGEGLGRVRADRGQIEQVILNLVLNARDACPRGGRLTIETENVELEEAYTQEHQPVQPGSYVLLAVSDSGEGMDAATRARIFEPFFTTKERGKGTGLGLATVYGIVKQSGGYIWVYSEPGFGTTFKVYLPRVAAEDEREHSDLAPVPAHAAAQGGSETLLLVEDEERVRDLARDALMREGYRVLTAADGEEATRIAARHAGPIHLLLTDVVMPGMSGRELAERLAPLRRDLRVLFISGYTDDAVVRHGVLGAGVSFLQKPFTPGALARKVRESLDRGAPARLA